MKILYLLLAVLKFLGIGFLILLLLLLFLVIIILTVPIKYSVYINKSDEIYVFTTLRWLYSMLGMDIIYESGSEITKRIKLFGIVISPKKVKKLKTKSSDIQIPKEIVPDSKEKNSKEEDKKVKKTKDSQKETTSKDKKDKKEKKSKKAKKKKTGLKDIIAQIQSYKHKKELIADTIKWIGMIFKRLWPKTIQMEIEIGKEDPAETGQLIGMLSALIPLYYSFASIVGNYEKECFYGKLEAKGDIGLGKFVYDFTKYIRTTSVKELIKLIRKNRKGKENGRKVTK